MLAGKGKTRLYQERSSIGARSEKRSQERKFSLAATPDHASFGFHLFRQRRTADIIEGFQLLAVMRLQSGNLAGRLGS